ncbi:MAG: lytic transglycosylase domain-containing protein [Gammaproteobacteria bacterium]|nr:lytic transglycosylase domain-containing protein [Gammaproteobacteria bacterium]
MIMRTNALIERPSYRFHRMGKIPRFLVGATRMGALAALATLAVSSSMVFARDDGRTQISIDIPAPTYERPTWYEERDAFGARLSAGYELEDALAVEFAGWILEAATRQDLEPELLASLVMTESSFRKVVRSSVGAVGPTQVQPLLWKEFCAVDLMNPEENLYCGAQILAYYRERCAVTKPASEDAQSCALRSYNVGYRNRDNDYFLPAATRYVAKINRHLASLAKS